MNFFEFDAAKSESHRAKHGIDFVEAQEPECVNDFATPGVINLLCSVVYLFAPPFLVD